jgi:hypothetical protein
MRPQNLDEMLHEAHERVALLTNNLPRQFNIAALGASKIPFKVLSCRESFMWRGEELSRSSVTSFRDGYDLSGILLTRGFMETCACMNYLHQLVMSNQVIPVSDDLDEKVMRLLLGHKNREDLPEAHNILNLIDMVGKEHKEIKGKFRDLYNKLSEYAHPNWIGSSEMYSSIDKSKWLINFGKSIRAPETHRERGLLALNLSLALFEISYNEMADYLPSFIEACNKSLK